MCRQDDGGGPQVDKVWRRGHRDAGADQAAVRGVVPGVPAARPLRRAGHAPDRRRWSHQGVYFTSPYFSSPHLA